MKRFAKIFLLFALAAVFSFHSCSTSSFFYYPDKTISKFPDTSICRYEEVNFKASDENILYGWFIKPKSDTVKIKASVLFLHGNGGNVGYQSSPIVLLAQHGFQGLVFDYEGYGKSEGKPSQEKVLDDAERAFDYISEREDIKKTKLILFGQSLGGHLLCALAGKIQEQPKKNRPFDAVVIEGAFSSHRNIAAYRCKKDYHVPGFVARFFVPSKYDAVDYIDKITAPKLIIHSSEDEVCPLFMGKNLFETAKEPKKFWEIKGAHIAGCKLYPDEFVKKFEEIISQQ